MTSKTTHEIAEITHRNNRYCKGWFLTVINADGAIVSELGKWFDTKAEAVASMQEKHPAATLVKKLEFSQQHTLRSYRGDNS